MLNKYFLNGSALSKGPMLTNSGFLSIVAHCTTIFPITIFYRTLFLIQYLLYRIMGYFPKYPPPSNERHWKSPLEINCNFTPSGFLPGDFSGGGGEGKIYCYSNFSIVYRPNLRGSKSF